MASETGSFPSYPMFKGLQRPLEFMGLQGRYITWAAASAAVAILGFIIGYCVSGLMTGLLILLSGAGAGAVLILVKQRKGLHSKKNDKGVFVYSLDRRF